MKIFIVAVHLLVLSTLGKAQGDPTDTPTDAPTDVPTDDPNCDDPYGDECDMADYDVLKITCKLEAGVTTCECVPKAEGGDACTAEVTAALPEDGALTADSCRTLCGTQSEGEADKKCYFYRWEQNNNPKRKFECTMRSTDKPCVAADPCPPGDVCVSGHIDCGGGAPPTPAAPVPCPGKIQYDADKIHWRCIETHPNPPIPPQERSILGNPNPYMDDTLPPDTICITMKKCHAWDSNEGDKDNYEYELVARCDGTKLTGGNGTWVADDETGDRDVTNQMIKDNTLIEPDLAKDCATTCEPDFVLSEEVRDIPGIEVFCTYPLENWTVGADNSCILLCDQELQNSVSCVYSPVDGTKSWKDYEGVAVAPEDFICKWEI